MKRTNFKWIKIIPLLILMLGLTAFLEIDFTTYLWTTFIGILPGTFVYIMLGYGIGTVLEQGKNPNMGIIFKPAILLPIIGLAILALVPIVVKRVRRHG